MRRQISRLLLVLPATLLLATPVGGAAHAAKPNPWSAYFPGKGAVCTSTVVHADGTTESQSTTVIAKTAKKVVSRTTGEPRSTARLLPGGKLRTRVVITQRDAGIRTRGTMVGDFPSPTKLLHRRSGSGTFTMAMTLPRWMANEVLTSGRTLTVTGTYRLRGLGSRSITLADPAATAVDALGIRSKLRSVKVSGATSAYARKLKREMRSLFVGLEYTQWIARGRGTVQTMTTDDDGSAVTTTQVGCR